MDIQPILNKVLDAGLYSPEANLFMCHALNAARHEGLITPDEYRVALKQIHEYVHSINPSTDCLANCFDEQGRLRHAPDSSQPARLGDFVSGQGLAIFKDWANRPMP